MQWQHVLIKDTSLLDLLRRNVGAIVFRHTESGLFEPLGTVFPITLLDGSSKALAITAAHVLESAGRYLQGRVSAHPSSPFVDFRQIALNALTEHADKGRLTVLFGDGGTVYRAVSGYVSTAYDLAVLQLQHELGPNRPRTAFALDSDDVDVGAGVIVLGRNAMTANVLRKGDDSSPLLATFYSELRARSGVVVAKHAKGRNLQCPVYETNIPVPAGWSGSPVLLAPTSTNEPMRTIGVLSSDFSDQRAHDCNYRKGSSHFVPAFFLHGMRIATDGPTVNELVGRKLVVDVGRHVERIEVAIVKHGQNIRRRHH
jgi:hypothetical protein